MVDDAFARLEPGEVAPRRVTFADILAARADDDHPGLLFEDSSWSWAEVVRECEIRATALIEVARPGRRRHVGVLLPNVPEYIFLLGGAAFCGATVVGINSTRRGAELAADIRGTDCDLIITDRAGQELLAGLDTGVPEDRMLVEAWDARVVAARSRPAPVVAAAADPATQLLLTFTSGSTGAPKAVICSTGRLATLAAANICGLTSADTTYNAMPLFHGNAIMACWAPSAFTGATFSMRRSFSVSGFLPDIRRFGATYFNYVGRSLAYLLSAPESPLEADTRLRVVFGTEAAPRDRAEFERRFGVVPVESYGSSEGAVVIGVTPDTPPNSLGRAPETMRVEIHDEAGRECPRARFDDAGLLVNPEQAIGEIVNATGATMFEGYYNNDEATAERLNGPVFRTGDLGYRDEAGFFYFAGRSGDRLRVDSENFASAPIERIIARFPVVALVAVYPVPDARTGDQVMAAIQLTPGQRFDPEAFGQFLATQPDLGTKWAPRYVRIIADMPVTATRKINKPALRGQSWQVEDPLYLIDPKSTRYRLATPALLAELTDEYARYGRSPTSA